MADEKDELQETQQAEEPKAEPQGKAEDWEAKYRELLKDSRKWEDRAKRDEDAAKKWREQQEAGKSEVDKLTEQVIALTKENDQLKTAEQQRLWAAEVAEAKGVPVAVLRGSTKEEMESHADAILSSGLSMHSGVPDKGETAAPSITREQIMAIKDPVQRVKAISENLEKFK